MGVLDAIDHLLRRRSVVALRLGVCAARVVVVFEVGMWDVVELVALSPGDGRWDEFGPVLVSMFLNLSVGRWRLREASVWGACRRRARWWGHGHRGGLVLQCLFTRELLTVGRDAPEDGGHPARSLAPTAGPSAAGDGEAPGHGAGDVTQLDEADSNRRRGHVTRGHVIGLDGTTAGAVGAWSNSAPRAVRGAAPGPTALAA